MICETDTTELRLYKTGYRKIGIVHCCHKENEIIKEFSYDEILAMDAETFINELNTLYYKPYKFHNPKTYFYCKTKEQKCNYSDKFFNSINVSTLNNCNINCIMCDYAKDKTIDAEDKTIYFNILNKVKNKKINKIVLTEHGEPFFYKNETMDYIKNLTLNDCKYLEIITNTIMLNTEDIYKLAEYFKESKIKPIIICSCSGITEETYKKIHNNNCFEKVVNNIKLLNDLKLLTTVNFVIMKNNLHELGMYKQFWKNYNVTSCTATVVSGPRYLKEGYDILKSKEYKDYLNEM